MPDRRSGHKPHSSTEQDPAMPPPRVTRHVAHRDGREEGEPDMEPSAGSDQAMKDAQRDLTSLSGPPPRSKHPDRPEV